MKQNITFLAVDLGTSFIKTGLYDTAGNCLASAKEMVEDERPEPGVVIQRAEKLFASVVCCIQKTVKLLPEKAHTIEAISFTGQMAGFMGVDQDWNDVTSWSCFIDGRYVPYANQQREQYSMLFRRISGTNAPLMAPKITWFRTEYPKESEKIRKYLMISGYIIGRFSGCPVEEAVMDQSFLSWTGLGDVARRDWSEEICRLVGVEKQFLPRVVKSNEICGTLSAEMAGKMGLRSGIPLVSGAGDKMSGCLGTAAFAPGDMVFEAGSYGAVSCMTKDYCAKGDEQYYDIIPSALDLFCAHKYIPGSGITLNWFMDTFLKGMDKSEAFAYMEASVPRLAPGCEGLTAVGLLGGSAMPFKGELKGSWSGFSWSHRPEHFYRALLESYAYDLAITLDSICETYPECEQSTVKVIGGGARSGAWLQILADVTGRTFQRVDREDAALWGAVLLAGDALGVFPDIRETAREHIRVTGTILPDESQEKIYRKLKDEYREMLECNDSVKNLSQ